MHLLQLDGRMDAHLTLLARALAGYRVALRLLSQRMAVMADEAPDSSLEDLVGELMHGDARGGMLHALLDAAAMSPTSRTRAASMAARASATGADAANPAALKNMPDRPWTRYPYPLLSDMFTDIKQLSGMSDRPIFTCKDSSTGKELFIKFTPRRYPEQASLQW
jgi:hypothetical protein